jgi:hypothetical protein
MVHIWDWFDEVAILAQAGFLQEPSMEAEAENAPRDITLAMLLLSFARRPPDHEAAPAHSDRANASPCVKQSGMGSNMCWQASLPACKFHSLPCMGGCNMDNCGNSRVPDFVEGLCLGCVWIVFIRYRANPGSAWLCGDS